MSCQNVQERFSSHLDGMLTTEEQESVLAHTASCRTCSAQLKVMEGLRSTLRQLEAPPIPPALAVELRVLASHERVRQLARASWSTRIEYWAERLILQFDNLMRPVALPFAGGIVSALLLFGMLVPNLSFQHKFTDEPPLAFSSDPDGRIVDWNGDLPRLESVNGNFSGDETVVELTIDDQGRVADYAVRQGKLTYEMQSIIMFSKFTPAMFFYQPAWGKKLVVFPGRRRARG